VLGRGLGLAARSPAAPNTGHGHDVFGEEAHGTWLVPGAMGPPACDKGAPDGGGPAVATRTGGYEHPASQSRNTLWKRVTCFWESDTCCRRNVTAGDSAVKQQFPDGSDRGKDRFSLGTLPSVVAASRLAMSFAGVEERGVRPPRSQQPVNSLMRCLARSTVRPGWFGRQRRRSRLCDLAVKYTRVVREGRRSQADGQNP
jgi:hypothetical protein